MPLGCIVAACALLLSASPSAAQTQAEMRAASERGETEEFYRLNDWRPVWTPQLRNELGEILAGANRHGIEVERIRPHLVGNTPAEADVELTALALRYASALAEGIVDPTTIHGVFTLNRNQIDETAELDRAIGEHRLTAWFERLAPQDAAYAVLSRRYIEARAAIGEAEHDQIRAGPLLRQGDEDARMPVIARALTRAGYLTTTSSNVYDEDAQEQIEAMQRENGLNVDGVIGPRTLAVLNRGPFERAGQLAVNLERRRWLSRAVTPDRIDVNIAAATLVYFRQGAEAWRTKTIVGAVGHETPLLEEPFHTLVVNPPWHVPQSIAASEILPRGEDYLRNHDMYVENGRVIQRPSPHAALGQVKFDMRNQWAIYLHDTPAKALFERAFRQRSHGCVRVQHAVDFARRLAREHGREAQFDQLLEAGDTAELDLGAPIVVRLLYRTAFAENGDVIFRRDVYGWDDDLAAAMGLPRDGPRTRAAITAPLFGP